MNEGLGLFDNGRRRGRAAEDDGYRDNYADEYADEYYDEAADEDGYDEYDEYDEYDGEDEPPRRKNKKVRWLIVIAAVVIVLGGAGFGVAQVLGFGYYPDYSGSGTSDVVFQVNAGSVRSIGGDLASAGIVESEGAFVKASKSSDQIQSVQPGFYLMKEHMSGAAAVAQLTDPASRVGRLQIKSGWQLDDTTAVNGQVTKGILARISAATCATLNGKSTCIPVATLQSTIRDTNPAELGVPPWALSAVTAADPKHRLEGLIAPGVYDVKPGETAIQTLKRILTQSAAQLQTAGLPISGQGNGFSSYQILTIASIVERESGTAADDPKVARVLYNRLALPMNLQLDSTVDYALDRPMVATSPSEQPLAGAYNTYGNPGLPPTPISSPSVQAIQAAEQPAAGPWLYFVVCQKDKSSCFDVDFTGHEKSVALAHNNGVF